MNENSVVVVADILMETKAYQFNPFGGYYSVVQCRGVLRRYGFYGPEDCQQYFVFPFSPHAFFLVV